MQHVSAADFGAIRINGVVRAGQFSRGQIHDEIMIVARSILHFGNNKLYDLKAKRKKKNHYFPTGETDTKTKKSVNHLLLFTYLVQVITTVR